MRHIELPDHLVSEPIAFSTAIRTDLLEQNIRIAELEALLGKVSIQLEERDKTINKHDKVITDQDKQLAEMEKSIAEREKRIDELEALLGKNATKSSQKIPKIPDIPEEDRTPTVVELLEIIHLQKETIQALRDEIAQLKRQKPKPKIKPSKLEKDDRDKDTKDKDKQKRKKRSKTRDLVIHETNVIQPDNIPEGSKFKDYEDYTVQGLIIRPHNIRYRLGVWVTPQGERLVGKLPDNVVYGHFDVSIKRYILQQYHQAGVTQPLIWEELNDIGIDISTGQVNNLLIEDNESFHAEKDEILKVGLETSSYINTDDTNARHKGKNGFCTHIGNDMFAWFSSTESKSRVNFLELLQAGKIEYRINDTAIDYMRIQKLAMAKLEQIALKHGQIFEDKKQWEAALVEMGITDERHVRIATEGALVGSLVEKGWNPDLVILSDNAGQFNILVLLHALCWIHAERTINKLVGFNEQQRAALDEIRGQIWDFYNCLKVYKQNPHEALKVELEERFDDIFTTRTCFATLNLALKRLYNNKPELLLVLYRPEIPLHNNNSERDIREYAKRRKISGSTRSDEGRRCRDTFASLKKTSRKLKVSFWDYLKDRLSGLNEIPPLPEIMRQRAQVRSP